MILLLILLSGLTTLNAQITGCTTAVNQVQNPDFSKGDTAFTSQFTKSTSDDCTTGAYIVANNFLAKCGSWPNVTGHSSSADFLIIDGDITNDLAIVWQQDVKVCAGINYTFSFWGYSIYADPFTLTMTIKGLGQGYIPPFTTANITQGSWTLYSTNWTAAATGIVSIAILQTTLGHFRDFGIDDIFFGYCGTSAPPFTVSGSTAICAGSSTTLTAGAASTYSWSTGEISPSITVGPLITTTYTVMGHDGCGPTRSVTATITVLSLPPVSVANHIICPGSCAMLTANGAGLQGNYVWSSPVYPPNGDSAEVCPSITSTYIVTGTDANGCSNTASAVVNVQQAFVITGTNKSICAGEQVTLTASGSDVNNYTWQPGNIIGNQLLVSPSQTTIYTVTGATMAGCSNSALAVITVNPSPNITVNPSTICVGESTSLTASGGSGTNYTWIPSLGILQTGNPIALIPAATLTFTVIGKASNDCINTTSALVTVNPLPVFEVSNTTVCKGMPGTITASGAGAVNYVWQLTGQNGPVLTDIPSQTTTYVVTGTDANGCSKTASGVVTVQQVPVIASTDKVICAGEQATLTASGSDVNNYTWQPGNIIGSQLLVSPSQTTTYTVMSADPAIAGCGNSTKVTVTVNPIPLVNFEPDTTGCIPLHVVFRNNSTGMINSVCTWYFGDGSPEDNNPIPHHIYTTPGIYSVKLVVSSLGCTNSLVRNGIISAYDPPTPGFNAEPRQTEILEPVIQFTNASTGSIKNTWYFGDGTFDSVNNPLHTYKDTGHFKVCLKVQNASACVDSICSTVIIKPVWSFYMPNAFTPNGDGINDAFNAKAENIYAYELFIYDRWGNKIFYSNSIFAGWDGTANAGKDLAQQDVYVYVVNFKDIFSQNHTYTGSVTLLK